MISTLQMEVARTAKRARDALAIANAAYSAYKGIGPINYRTRYNSGKYAGKAGKRWKKWRSKKQIKQLIRSQTETKHTYWAPSRFQINHNGGPTKTSAAFHWLNSDAVMPQQNDTEFGRDGNDIWAVGHSVRWQINVPQDRLNSKFRIMVLRVTKGYTPASSYSNIFDPVTNNVMLDPFDTGRVKCVFQKVVGARNINPGVPTTGKEITLYGKIWIPTKGVIKFWDDGGGNGNSQVYDYWLVCYGYDTWGSLDTDVVGYFQVCHKFYFKDK